MRTDDTMHIADDAELIWDNITIGKDSSIWYNSAIGCDENESIDIGEGTNIQDLCVIHIDSGASVNIDNRIRVAVIVTR